MPQENNQGNKLAWPWADLPAYRADYRRRNPVPDPGEVVADLALRKQWLIWRYEPGETEEKKYRKMPYYAGGGKRFGGQGNDKDRSRLVTLDAAVTAIGKGDFDGLGFAFLPGDGLIGIDLDGMIDPDSGELNARCQSIIDACDSYTELSPSGKGVHIFCGIEHAEGLHSFKSNKIGVECFVGAQFFTFTGRWWSESPKAVNDLHPKTLARLRATVESAKGNHSAPGAAPVSVHETAPNLPSIPGRKQYTLAERVALVEEAIKSIDPNSYEVWIEMGMACSTLGTSGYVVWDTWSAGSPKYSGQEDTAKRWRSFKDTRITLGSLFAKAEAAGWESPWAKAAKRKAGRESRKASRKDYDYGRLPDSPPVDSSETHFDATKAPAESGVITPDEIEAAGRRAIESATGASDPQQPDDDDWKSYLVRKSGDVTPCLANAELILSRMKPWEGAIAYDEFAERTVFRKRLPCDLGGPDSGEWSDHLDSMTAIWLQRAWRVEFSPSTVGQAIEVVARRNRFHPVREALAQLPSWDGVRRNGDWLSDYLGVKKTEYTQLVGAFFLRAMVKRVMEPGCKFDYCLVLEGEQGLGKSTVARILAWHWFADTDLDLSNKDALMALAGHWVYEISEMGSLMRAEEKKQKSFLSRQDDEYRPPYGKRMIKVPRQSVFIGTTNEEEYLKDATGGRRFWPVYCSGEFNISGLRENIHQMYAEALHDYRSGERCFPVADEQNRLFTPEQAKRGMQEPLGDILYTWVKGQPGPFSMAEAATDGLKLTADKLTPALVTRLGIALNKIGCGRKEDRLAIDPSRRRLYVPPHLRDVVKSGAPAVEEAKNAYGW